MKHANVLNIFRRIGLGLVALLGLLIAGITYQSVAAAQEAKRYPAPGKLVEVEGYNMHLYCTGSGSPTVILEAGAGGSYLDWSLVQPAVAGQTRVCTYDRAGQGYSDYLAQPQDAEMVARRLHRLLAQADIAGPYVMVGHSYGGIHVRTFARLYPDEVAGMVLVDSSHEQQAQYLPDLNALLPWPVRAINAHGPLLARLGVIRVLHVPQIMGADMQLDEEEQAFLTTFANRPAFWRCQQDESRMVAVDTNQASGPQPLGEMPLIVLTAGESVPAELNVSPEIASQINSTWAMLQQELAGLSTRSEHIVAEKAGHYIQIDRPELVIASIQQVVAAAEAVTE